MKFRGRLWILTEKPGVPADLPPWARDELVAGRLRIVDLEMALARAMRRNRGEGA